MTTIAPSGAPYYGCPDDISLIFLQEIRVSRRRIEGDLMAENVLEALTGMVTLYGEQLILVQYLPYAWDLLMICR